MFGLGCDSCGGTCGGKTPPLLNGLSHLDFSQLPTKSNLTREIEEVSDAARWLVILQAVASISAAGMLYITWMNYCDNKRKGSRSKR